MLKTDPYDTEIDGETVTVEVMELIEEFKDILGIEEVYFETDTFADRRGDLKRINDKALWSLYHEQYHDRFEKD